MSLLDDASLLLTPNAYKEGKLYSVIPSNGNGDFTATRATTATRVNSAGLVDLVPYNLFQYSEMFADAYWVKSSSNVTANTTTAPNGTLTADTVLLYSSSARIEKSVTLTSNIDYTHSIYVKNIDASNNRIGMACFNNANTLCSGIFDLVGSGSVHYSQNSTATIQSVGNGWYRCLMTFNSQSGATSPTIRIAGSAASFSGWTTGQSIYAWGAQLVEGTSARDYLRTETRLNIPRIDYSLGGCPNILLEPQRTNVFLNSVFSGSGAAPTSWPQAAGTGTSVLTTSTLGAGAQACSQSATNQRPFLYQDVTLLANTTYSYSIYIESVGGGLTNDQVLAVANAPSGSSVSYFLNGVSVSGGALVVVGRLSVNIVVSSTGGSASFRCGIGCSSNATGTLLFSRPQLEAGAYATSYIPTTTASVTRNADSITRNNIFTNGLITSAGGTWFVELRNNVSLIADNATLGLWLGTSNATSSSNGTLYFRQGGGASRVQIWKFTGGTGTSLFSTTTDTTKVAIKWNGTTADIFVNGVKQVSATAFAHNNMEFLNNSTGRNTFLNEMALFPTPLTDAQCIALTQ